MSGIPQLTPLGSGQLSVPSTYPNQLSLTRYFDMNSFQYGVGNVMPGMSGLASMIPVVGPLIGAGMNMLGSYMQNQQQEEFFNEYMSPQARMAQMRSAGINPNAAAQGISGSSASQMNAAAPTGAFTGIGEQLGNSVNTSLTASAIKAGIAKTDAETDLTNSLNTEKTITNSYLDRMQMATLNKLVADGRISRSFANMAVVDEAYKPATAAASYQQMVANLNKTAAEIEHLTNSALHELAGVYQSMAAASLSEAQIHRVFSDIGLNNAMINRISHEVSEIDARTAATYQGIDESKARTAAQEIQNKFQNDYYDIWQNTGFNWNSDIEKSIVGAYQNYDIKSGDRMMHSLGAYINGVGAAKASSVDSKFDYALSVLSEIGGLLKIVK